jgi:hypothetical protein
MPDPLERFPGVKKSRNRLGRGWVVKTKGRDQVQQVNRLSGLCGSSSYVAYLVAIMAVDRAG